MHVDTKLSLAFDLHFLVQIYKKRKKKIKCDKQLQKCFWRFLSAYMKSTNSGCAEIKELKLLLILSAYSWPEK